MTEKTYKIPSTIARWKKFIVETPKTGRKFRVIWVRDESQLRPNWKGFYMQDTFIFDTKKDCLTFPSTSFFKRNGLEVGVAYHDMGIGAKETWFVKDAEVIRRISAHQYGPRG